MKAISLPLPKTHEAQVWIYRRAAVDETGCWIWALAKTAVGYGLVTAPGKFPGIHLAHRLAYAAFIGPVPEGKLVCHKCDTPSCCNPDHLFLGTHRDNTQDSIAKGRYRENVERYGEEVGGHKLSDLDVEAIRRRRAEGELLRSIAASYAVWPTTVGRICRGESRKHPSGYRSNVAGSNVC